MVGNVDPFHFRVVPCAGRLMTGKWRALHERLHVRRVGRVSKLPALRDVARPRSERPRAR